MHEHCRTGLGASSMKCIMNWKQNCFICCVWDGSRWRKARNNACGPLVSNGFSQNGGGVASAGSGSDTPPVWDISKKSMLLAFLMWYLRHVGLRGTINTPSLFEVLFWHFDMNFVYGRKCHKQPTDTCPNWRRIKKSSKWCVQCEALTILYMFPHLHAFECLGKVSHRESSCVP